MIQKRLAASIMNCSPARVRFDPAQLAEIGQAITKNDVRRLIKQGAITKKPMTGISNFRLKKRQKQQRRDRRTGMGSRKGLATARTPQKQKWMSNLRAQRALLFRLRERKKVSDKTFTMLYAKVKGAFFRSTHHIKLYLEEQKLFMK